MRTIGKKSRIAILNSAAFASPAGRLAYMRQAPLFYGLSSLESIEIARAAHVRSFASQQLIFRLGQPITSIFVLASGRVKITQFSRAGAHILLKVVEAGNLVGGLGLEPGSTFSVTAQALEACSVLSWEAQLFDSLCARLPQLARNCLRILMEQQLILEERILELATEQAAQRLAGMLVRLLEQSGCSIHKPARIALLRGELAEMIGATIFTVSRLLCDWANLGLLEHQRSAVVVRNPIRLIEFAEAIRRTA